MTQEPTFLFCVGATKAGTSWLHAHLAAHDDCHFRSVKELHYFGLSDGAKFSAALKRVQTKAANLSAQLDHSGKGDAKAERRLADLCDWQDVLNRQAFDLAAYRSYLTKDAGPAKVVGDVTPAYALLPSKTLQTMLAIGRDVRVLYLIRDPLARLWSHVRMAASRAAPQNFAANALALLDRITAEDVSEKNSGIVARGDYASILPKLTAVFGPKRLLVMFYEDLISKAGVARLAAFLGIVPGRADVDRWIHKGVPLALPAAARQKAIVFLRPQYDYIIRLLGDIPAAWHQNMNEGLA